jgi:hypothetical protein
MRRDILERKQAGETDHEIAQALNLRNGGRVSEILRGLR